MVGLRVIRTIKEVTKKTFHITVGYLVKTTRLFNHYRLRLNGRTTSYTNNQESNQKDFSHNCRLLGKNYRKMIRGIDAKMRRNLFKYGASPLLGGGLGWGLARKGKHCNPPASVKLSKASLTFFTILSYL